MNPEWIKTLKELSVGGIALGVLVWALNMWHEERQYSAETDRMNTQQMAAVITESLVASREDRRRLTNLSADMMKKLRANEQAETAILDSLQEIIGLIREDRVEVKNELQDIVDQLQIQTKSFKRESKR